MKTSLNLFDAGTIRERGFKSKELNVTIQAGLSCKHCNYFHLSLPFQYASTVTEIICLIRACFEVLFKKMVFVPKNLTRFEASLSGI